MFEEHIFKKLKYYQGWGVIKDNFEFLEILPPLPEIFELQTEKIVPKFKSQSQRKPVIVRASFPQEINALIKKVP